MICPLGRALYLCVHCMSVFLYFLLFVLSGKAMIVVDAFAHQSFFCKAEFCSKLGLELKPIFLMTLYSTQLFQSLGAETQLQIYSALATGKLIKSLLQQYDKIFRYYLLDQSRFTHRGCCKDTRNCQKKVMKISHLKPNQSAPSIYIMKELCYLSLVQW